MWGNIITWTKSYCTKWILHNYFIQCRNIGKMLSVFICSCFEIQFEKFHTRNEYIYLYYNYSYREKYNQCFQDLRSFEEFSCLCTLLFDKRFKLSRSDRETWCKQLVTINKPNLWKSEESNQSMVSINAIIIIFGIQLAYYILYRW